jgi:hypothetical protein
MMTDTQLIPAGRAGAALATFVPTNMDELKRMAQWAAVGGMAPKSLTDGKNTEQATAACAIAIMAGAELGLTPMMALRSYAVVNGRPTLWGDGLIAVVMKSSSYKVGSLKRGYDEAGKFGWCEAERTDGTKWREEFTEAQAKKAGLLTKKGPWQEYPDVMMTRRAISKCLNFLFADVLGGFVTEDEAYYAYETVDVIPNRPMPPPAPKAPETGTVTAEATGTTSSEASTEVEEIIAEADARMGADQSSDLPKMVQPEDDMNGDDSQVSTEQEETTLEKLEFWCAGAKTVDEITEAWKDLGVEGEYAEGTPDRIAAEQIRTKHLDRVETIRQGNAVGDLLAADASPPPAPKK